MLFTELNDNVVFPDGTKFYPDVQNGVHGYNTDPQRGADTFHPFSQLLKVLHSGNVLTPLSGTYTLPADGTYTIFIHTQQNGNGATDSVTCSNSSASITATDIAKYMQSGYSYIFRKHVLSNAKKGDVLTIKAPSNATMGSGTCFIFAGNITV